MTQREKSDAMLTKIAMMNFANPSYPYYMCCDNACKTTSTAFWKRTMKTCEKPHTMPSETTVR